MADMIRHYTGAEMTPEALRASGLVLVDMWAPWCGPCRMIAPVLEQLAEENSGKVTIAKLNIDEYGEEAVRMGVQSIPTMILFKDGKEVDRMIGAHPKAQIQEMLNRHISAELVKHYTAADMTPEALRAAGTVLVDMWAPWCGPCRMVAPILEQLAAENAGKVTVAKLNIDDYGAEAVNLGVQSIPTMILFKDGEEAERLIGAYPKAHIQAMLDRNI